MIKGLEALEKIKGELLIMDEDESGACFPSGFYKKEKELNIIKKELKEKEKQENALKTISDIIRDYNKGEFANGECALKEITNILKEVLNNDR